MNDVDVVNVQISEPITVRVEINTGVKGDAGKDGAAGSAGKDGADGVPGKDGAAASISIGVVTTGEPGTPATVTNTGTATAAVLDFSIPRGVTGAVGIAGKDGAAGADGAAGVGVPTGGTTGQVLAKKSVADYDTEWIAQSGGGSAASSLEATFTVPQVADFIQQNFSATLTSAVQLSSPLAGIRLSDKGQASNVNYHRQLLQPVPGAHWKATARIKRLSRWAPYGNWGISVRDAILGTSFIFSLKYEANGIGYMTLSNDNTFASTVTTDNKCGNQTDIWLRVQYTGTYTFYYSFDGIFWINNVSNLVNSTLLGAGGVASHVGVGIVANNYDYAGCPVAMNILSWELVSIA